MTTEKFEIVTPDGTADAELTRPDGNEKLPGVILLTDIYGLRPVVSEFASRIAEHGYVVLAPNIFYRTSRPPVFAAHLKFPNEDATSRMRELTAPITPDAMVRDGSAYVDFLAAQSGVSDGPMGVVGFCFSGQFALRMAAARADRIAAAASFHGGGLVTDTDHSPHLELPKVKAHLYFGHAENDRGMPAEAIAKLEEALKAWGGVYGNETYAGAGHGWMVADRPVYNPPQAERGFIKLIALLDAALHDSQDAEFRIRRRSPKHSDE